MKAKIVRESVVMGCTRNKLEKLLIELKFFKGILMRLDGVVFRNGEWKSILI